MDAKGDFEPSTVQDRHRELGTIRDARPFEGPGVLRRTLPLVVAVLIAIGVGAAAFGGDGLTIALVCAAIVGGVVLVAVIPWQRLPGWTQAIPPLSFLLAVAFLRDAQGGAPSELTPLVALPVIWFALYGTRWQIVGAVVAATLTLALPVPLLGYPDSEIGLAAFYAVLMAMLGLAAVEIALQRKALVDELAKQVRTDPLTGIANRRGWEETLRRELAGRERKPGDLSVAILDLDHFKEFNDRYGHADGDRLLKEAVARWSEQIRSMDMIARIGGEEFALLLPGARLEQAGWVLDRIRMSTPRDETVSGGIAEWDGSESAAALLARADRALYRAKELGRDRIVIG